MILTVAAALLVILWTPKIAGQENTDPQNDGSQFAWAENVGWLNAEPLGNGGPGVSVNDLELSGWMWGENTGWVSLSCANTGTCGGDEYRVHNDGCGVLAGFAWAENAGWINFSPTNGGVTIDPRTGVFTGRAWGENVGWITFADDSPVAYNMVTGWRRFPPGGFDPSIGLSKDVVNLTVSWGAVGDADGYDLMSGPLQQLRDTGGDFGVAVDDCLANDQITTSFQLPLATGSPMDFFLVRAVNCGGDGSINSGGDGQIGDRDNEITAAGVCS